MSPGALPCYCATCVVSIMRGIVMLPGFASPSATLPILSLALFCNAAPLVVAFDVTCAQYLSKYAFYQKFTPFHGLLALTLCSSIPRNSCGEARPARGYRLKFTQTRGFCVFYLNTCVNNVPFGLQRFVGIFQCSRKSRCGLI